MIYAAHKSILALFIVACVQLAASAYVNQALEALPRKIVFLETAHAKAKRKTGKYRLIARVLHKKKDEFVASLHNSNEETFEANHSSTKIFNEKKICNLITPNT